MQHSPVETIKERLSITDVIGGYLTLESAGANWKARCPFHNEKTPSFFVSPARNSYYCFGCSAKGDIFTFVEQFEGVDFLGALKILADRAGVDLSTYTSKTRDEMSRLYEIMERTTLFYQKELSKNPEALAYLASRGLTEETITLFRIGYAPNEWRLAHTMLSQAGFSDIEIEKVGLIKPIEKNGVQDRSGYYDRFRGRIMFPINDSSGRVIAFTGRVLVDDSSGAKYLNSPDTVLFDKSSVLFGLDKAKHAIRQYDHTVLVEGQFDVIMAHQVGCTNTVALSGTALGDTLETKEHMVTNLGLATRLSRNVKLVFDADKAGFRAAIRSAKIALSLGMDVKVARIPEGKDPADIILEHGVTTWKHILTDSKHVILFYLETILGIKKDAYQKIRDVRDHILPFVSALSSTVEQSYFIKQISEATQITQEALLEDLKKVKPEYEEKKSTEKQKTPTEELTRRDSILRRILGVILWQESLSERRIDCEYVRRRLTELLGDIVFKDFSEASQDVFGIAEEAERRYESDLHLKETIEDELNALQEELLTVELKEHITKIGQLEKDGTEEKNITALVARCQSISHQLHEIRQKRHVVT